nr:MAG TPA: hypothetical protein [Caudoviricetes sp.]
MPITSLSFRFEDLYQFYEIFFTITYQNLRSVDFFIFF